jgi:hypothetical protein
MEVKWNRVKGRFSHKAHLRRLAGMQKRRLKRSFRQETLPEVWEQTLEGYDAIGFSWQAESISGKGILLYSPASRVATLVQFYRKNTMMAEADALRLLASFRDQISGGVMHWELFDIRAAIPVEFALQRYRFEAGQYELNLSSRYHQLRMIRWSPAATLLRRQDLPAMAKKTFLPGIKQTPQWSQTNAAAVEGRITPSSTAARVASRIRRHPPYRIFRLWHEIGKNRILGVQISGKRPVDHRQFSDICEKYETI